MNRRNHVRHDLYSQNSENEHRQDNNNNNDEDDNDGITAWIASIATTISRPVPFVDPPLAWGYPLALLASFGILPPTTSLLFMALFVLFSWLGRTVIPPLDDWDHDDDDEEAADDDTERPSTDLLALGASLVTSGIVAPFGSSSNDSWVLSWNQSPWIMVSMGGFLVLGLGFFLFRISVGKGLLPQASDTRSSKEQIPLEDPMLSNERQWMELWDKSLEEQESNKRGNSDTGL